MICTVHVIVLFAFFFNDTATTEIYTLSLHDALPISRGRHARAVGVEGRGVDRALVPAQRAPELPAPGRGRGLFLPRRVRSEEHTSELQSRQYLVCRLLLEKKNKKMVVKAVWMVLKH